MISISTQRLLLRAAQTSDAEGLYPVFADPEVMRFWSEIPHLSVAQTQAWVDSMMANESNGVTNFIIVDIQVSPHVPIGKIGIWNLSPPYVSGDLGFLIARSQWGKGLMFEALQALLQHLFLVRNFDFLTADADPGNAACIGLLKKVGFLEVGFEEKTYEVGGVWMDSLLFRLDRETWQTRQGINHTF